MAKPVIFGDFQFRTKTAAKEEIRRRISKYEPGSTLDLNDHLFFEELFKLHDEYENKISSGIKHIQVEKDFNGNRCFYIHRVDGSMIDISWVHCVQPASNKSTVSMSFRRSIKEKIIAFKSSSISKGSYCPILGISLDYKNSHATYIGSSFEALLKDFLTQTGNTYDSIKIENPKPQDSDQRGILKDQKLRLAWQVYHEKNARLELWSAEANLRKKN